MLDNSPHTREPRVSCICSSPELKEEMDKYGVQYISYDGPGTFGTTLHYLCQNRRIQMASMTVGATYYPEFNMVISYNPKAIRALVTRLNHLIGLNLDLSDLDKEVEDLQGKLASVARHNAEFAAYIKQLEKDFVEVKNEELLDMRAGEAVEIAEELLKQDKEGQ
jgi:proteasome assembly chaperone (PAC2) family protein